MAFDQNKYKAIFEKRFGSGSFESGLSSARSIGRTRAAADFAKQDYNRRLSEAKERAKNKTYDDALSEWQDPIDKEALKRDGAAKIANDIRNDPRKQEQIKAGGYSVDEYIDALYSAASDGKFRSEREYNQFSSKLNKDNKKEKEAMMGMTYQQYEEFTKGVSQQKEQKKEKDKKPFGLFDKIKKSEVGRAVKAAEDFFNPFDDVKAKDAVKNYLNHEQSDSFKEFSRGANRAVDSASLGAMSNLDKKLNDRDPYYTEMRKFGEGGGTDMLTSGLGYLVPGVGAYKALNATKAGAVLSKLGGQGLKQRLGVEAAKGAITGGGVAGVEVGIRESLNPDDYSAKENLGLVGLGIAGGAIADPLLYGAGKGIQNGLARFAKGDVPTFTGKPSNDILDRLRPSANTSPVRNSNELFDRLSNVQKSKVEVPKGQREIYKAQSRLEQISPKVAEINKEFDEAVQSQYEYLKNSMGKGAQSGGLVKDQEGYVTGAYGRVSNNPKWYQDFYSEHGRKPNNSELRQLAEEHVRNGFVDEVGELPPWKPKVVQEINDQIDELSMMINADPSQKQALIPIIRALEEDKANITRSISDVQNEYNALQRQLTKREIATSSLREYEPIEMAPKGGKMIKLKPNEVPRGQEPPVNIQNPKEIVKRQIDMKGKKEKSKWSFDKFMTAVVDDIRPIEKATKDLGGKGLKAEKNPYILARNARGVAGKAEAFLKGGVFSKEGKKVGKSLEEIIKPAEKNLDDLIAYITSKRAIDYDEKGLVSGIKPADVEGMTDRQLAEATIKQIEAENPAIKNHQKEIVKYSQHLMKELKDSGYYTDETIKQIFKENPNYVPMNRVQYPKVRGFQPLTNPKNKFASLTNPIKARTGSEKPIVNPVESIVKNTYLITNIAERNKVGSSLLNLIENAPEGNMWGRVVNVSKQDNSVDGLTKVLDEANSQLDDGSADAIDNLFKGEGNKIYAYRDGQKIEMEVQEDLYKAMLSLDTQKQNFFIKMLSVPTKTLRTGAVLSPDFGPVNIFRDQFSAFVNSKYGFVPFVDMFNGLSNVLKRDNVYWQWKTNGGANSVLSSLDREYLQKDIRSMVSRSLRESAKDRAKHPLDSVLSPLRKVSEITEEATRVGEFKKGLKKGASPTEAAFASRDLIDFNRAGSIGRQYNQITAFFNAAVQSIDKLARTFKENPIGATAKAFTGITLPSIAAYAYNHDKEWYKEIPQRERDLYWHFELDGQIYKLPKPFEAGVIFGTAAERMLAAMKDKDPKAFDGFLETVTSTFTPPWIPTALAPLIEVYGNKSMYFDSPIVPRREQDLLPEDQYGPYQSEISKKIGAATKSSPRNIEHVFKGYTGGLGKYALQLSDMGAQAMGANRPEMPDRGIGDIPVVNRFAVKNLEGNNQSINDFYEHMDQLRRISKSAKKNNEPNPDESAYKSFNKLNKGISELQAKKRQVIEDPSMSGKQKTEVIKRLDTQIAQLAKQGNSLR